MSQATSSKSDHRAKEIKHVLMRAGYVKPRMIVHTLQGNIPSIARHREEIVHPFHLFVIYIFG